MNRATYRIREGMEENDAHYRIWKLRRKKETCHTKTHLTWWVVMFTEIFNTTEAGCSCGGRAGRWFESCMSKCPWARTWTSNCSWWAAGTLHGSPYHQCLNVLCEDAWMWQVSWSALSDLKTGPLSIEKSVLFYCAVLGANKRQRELKLHCKTHNFLKRELFK